jgi:hypothetical protein
VNANHVTPNQLRRVPGVDANRAVAILKEPGLGVAVYSDGTNTMTMSYGTYKAQLASRFPPANCGELTLRAYCPPMSESAPQEMVSPLLLGVRQQQEETYQIPTRLWGGPSRTEHPGQRTGADAILMPLGLGPEPGPTRHEILLEREPAPPPPPPPEEPKRLRSWWDQWR